MPCEDLCTVDIDVIVVEGIFLVVGEPFKVAVVDECDAEFLAQLTCFPCVEIVLIVFIVHRLNDDEQFAASMLDATDCCLELTDNVGVEFAIRDFEILWCQCYASVDRSAAKSQCTALCCRL